MPNIIIDGRSYAFDPATDKRLLPFALQQGVEVPYFCYHPAMSTPTNCRMCLVEVGLPVRNRATGELELDENGQPKLMWGRKPNTACNTDLVPDMVVKTQVTSSVVKKAQEGVLEFMLINHPLDCPICDQAGECPLQINTYKYGPEGSRFELDKVHKPKRIELGPRVMLDAERCINCTRCTRFTEEVSQTNQLSIIQRGDKNFPATAPGQVFDDPYSMNVIDLCPVGALTSADFRFKARVWEMNHTPGICTGCSKGCNTNVWVRDNEVLRLTPRENRQVNQYWMCDEGRLGYTKYNTRRLSGTKRRGDVPSVWSTAIAHAAGMLKAAQRPLLVASPHASLESNYALAKLGQHLNARVLWVPNRVEGRQDHLLRTNDLAPNAAACQLLQLEETTTDALSTALAQADAVLALENPHLLPQLLQAADRLVLFSWNHPEGFEHVELLLGVAMDMEQPGIYINGDGRPQMTQQARQIAQMSPEDWMAMAKSRLDAGGQLTDRWRNPGHVLDVLAGWKVLAAVAGELGLSFGWARHADVVAELRMQFADALRDLPTRMGRRKESFKSSQLDFAIDMKRLPATTGTPLLGN